MDGLATNVARQAQRRALAATQKQREIGAQDALRWTEYVAKGTGPPKKDGPFDATTSGVRGPP